MPINRDVPVLLPGGLVPPPVSLLLTKLNVPRLRRQHVDRPRLSSRMDTLLADHPFALVWAPAGYGKTTLLAEWAAKSSGPVAWVSLDEGDNDPVRFWSYVVAAFQTCSPGLAERALFRLGSEGVGGAEDFLIELVNDIARHDEGLTLVLDDYHAVDSEAVHRQLSFLLDHAPGNLKVIIAARTMPPLPVARLVAGGQMFMMNMMDLSFTSAETLEFFSRSGIPTISTRDADLLRAKTEGWIAGLQMVSLSLTDRADPSVFIETFTGSDRLITDYLTDQALSSQPASVRDFLLATSILGRMNASLCSAATGQDETASQRMLEELERANMFIVALDDERRWYRYHQLFAEILRERLKQEHAAAIPTLYDRAITWHEQNGTIDEGIRLALEGCGHERAAALVETHYGEVVARGDTALLLDWLQALPADMVGARPRLALAKAWALVPLERIEEALRCLTTAEAGIPCDDEGPEASAMRAETLCIRLMIAMLHYDVDSITASAQRALELVPTERRFLHGLISLCNGVALAILGDLPAARRALLEAIEPQTDVGNVLLAYLGRYYLAKVASREGKLREAAKILEEALHIARTSSGGELPIASLAHVALAGVLYEWNQLERAEGEVLLGLELSRDWWVRDAVSEGHAILARIRRVQGDAAGAVKVCRLAFETSAGDYARPFITHEATPHLRAFITAGCLDASVRWAEGVERSFSQQHPLDSAALREFPAAAHLLFAAGKPEAARRLVEPLLDVAERKGFIRQVIELLVLTCLAASAKRDTSVALVALERALRLAEPEDYVRMFVDEGPPMLTLLKRARSLGVMPAYAERLVAAFGEPVPASPQGEPSVVLPLSKREIEVLRLAVLGLSSSEMAENLTVSAETVKFHFKNIYSKLGVHTRIQAVERAREFGLF